MGCAAQIQHLSMSLILFLWLSQYSNCADFLKRLAKSSTASCHDLKEFNPPSNLELFLIYENTNNLMLKVLRD